MNRTIFFILLFLTAANAVRITQLEFNPITVESNTKKYSPKVLQISFVVDLEEYEHHPAFSYSMVSSMGSVGNSTLHMLSFYTEPGKDTIVDLSINCTVYDIYTGLVDYTFTVLCTLIAPVVEGVCEIESFFPWFTAGNGLSSSKVTKVLETEQALWVIYGFREGIGSFDGNNWSYWDSTDGLINNAVSDIMKFKDGILVWNYGTGLDKFLGYYNGAIWKYLDESELLDHFGHEVLVDNGMLWKEYKGGGLFSFDGSTVTNYDTSNGLPSMESFFSLNSDCSGGVWIDFSYPDYILCHFDGVSWKSFTQFDSVQTKDLSSYNYLFDSTGGFFALNRLKNEIGYYNGISWEYYTSCVADIIDNINYVSVNRVLSGGKGKAWVEFHGAAEKAIVQVTTNSETVYTVSNGLLTENYTKIFPDQNGRLWVTYFENGIGHFDGNSWTNYTTLDNILSYDIEEFIINETNNAWIIYKDRNDISYFDGRKWIHFNSKNGLPDYHISKIIPISDGEAWAIFEYDIGIIKLPNSISTAISKPNTINNTWNKPIKIIGNTIHIANGNQEKMIVKVLNLKGQIVYLKKISLGIGNSIISLPKGLSNGLYLATFSIDNSTIVRKFLNKL